jgi:hypothetical protein
MAVSRDRQSDMSDEVVIDPPLTSYQTMMLQKKITDQRIDNITALFESASPKKKKFRYMQETIGR